MVGVGREKSKTFKFECWVKLKEKIKNSQIECVSLEVLKVVKLQN